MKRIRAAVIGAGFIGPAHVEALRRLGFVDVAVLAELDSAVAAAKADQFGVSQYTSSIDEALKDPDIDVMHVCAHPTICTTHSGSVYPSDSLGDLT